MATIYQVIAADSTLAPTGVDRDIKRWAQDHIAEVGPEVGEGNAYVVIVEAGIEKYIPDTLSIHRRMRARIAELASFEE